MRIFTKISIVFLTISFCILLIPFVLQKEFFLTSNFNLLIIICFAVSLAMAIFSLIKEKNGFSVVLIFISSIILMSLLLDTYDFKKIIFAEKTEEIPDSLLINQNFNSQPTEKQLLTEYSKVSGNTAIAVLELNENYTVFLLSANKKTPPESSILEFDYEISQFSSAELEARKSFSAIIIFENKTDFSAKIRQNSVSFFSNGQNIGTQIFNSQFQTVETEKEKNILRKIMIKIKII